MRADISDNDPDRACELVRHLAAAVVEWQRRSTSDPALRGVLRKTAAVWRDGLHKGEEIGLAAEAGGITLVNGTRCHGGGMPELATALSQHGASLLVIRGPLLPKALVGLVRAIVDPAVGGSSALEFDRALRAAGVKTGGPVDGDGSPPYDEPDTSAAMEGLAPELVECLNDLEQATDVARYNLAANRCEGLIDAMMRAKRPEEAWPVLRLYSRHGSDPRRQNSLGVEARDRMRRLVLLPGLLDWLIEQACVADLSVNVEAVQILMELESSCVPRLLQLWETGNTEMRQGAGAVIIALGDAALAPLCEELSDPDPARSRRAARMLGDLQNPGAVKALADVLPSVPIDLASEILKALGKIACDASVNVLAKALDNPGTAKIATACLGQIPRSGSLAALRRVVERRDRYDEAVVTEAIRSLGRIADPSAIPTLGQVLSQKSLLRRSKLRPLRVAAAQALGRMGGREAIAVLEAHTRGGDAAVREACTAALSALQRASRD